MKVTNPLTEYPARVRLKLVRDADPPGQVIIDEPDKVYTLVGEYLSELAREVVLAIYLDNRNQLLGIEEVSLGTSTEAILSPREIIKTALLISAINVIVVHNHPTGNPTPSPEDRSVTRVLQDALKVFSMTLLDHLIVGDGNWQSVLNG
jgi:DNA repair protein RadC